MILIEKSKTEELELKNSNLADSIEQSKLFKKFLHIANRNFYLKSTGNYFHRDYQTIVRVFVIFQKIIEIDNVKEQFKANVYVEASWEDNSIVDDLFDEKKYWTPKIYIANAVGKIKQDIKYRIEKKNHKIIVHEIRNIESVFWEKLELSDFPIDIQDLGIEITSERSVNEIRFESDSENESLINKESFQLEQEWNLFSRIDTEKTNFNDLWKAYKRPIFKISCKISRKPGYYLNNVFMLVFLMSVLGFITFSFEIKSSYRISVILTLILSSTNFRWVVTQRLPNLSYLTRLDMYAISGLLFLAFLCCWHAVICSDVFGNDNTARANADKIMLFVITFLFIFFHIIYTLIFFYKYAKYKKIDHNLGIYIQNKISPIKN